MTCTNCTKSADSTDCTNCQVSESVQSGDGRGCTDWKPPASSHSAAVAVVRHTLGGVIIEETDP